ncbi:hypothetical protein [Streptomyces nigrescens]
MTRGTGGEETRLPAVLAPPVRATSDRNRKVAEPAVVRPVRGGRHPGRGTRDQQTETAALGVRRPGAPVTAGPVGLTADLEGRHGRVAFGRGAVAV